MQKVSLYKTISFIALLLVFFAGIALADGEWNTSGANIFNTNSGNVGIGTNNPTSKLHVVGGGIKVAGASEFYDTVALLGVSPYLYIGSSSGAGQYGYLCWDDSNKLIKLAQQSSGGAGLVVDSIGNVGIGATGPGAKLHINGGVGSLATGLVFGDGDSGIWESTDDSFAITAGAATYVITPLVMGAASSTGAIIVATGVSGTAPTLRPRAGDVDTGVGSNAADTVSLIAGGTNGLNVISGGNVGIGTTNPGVKLDVAGGARIGNQGAAGILKIGNQSGNWEGDIQFLSSNSQKNWRIASNRIVGGALTFTPSTTGGDATFTTPAVTIFDNGNVGIGTINPQSKLAVNGTITTKKVKVTEMGWSDFVFEDSYKLPTLAAVESHIKQYKHLPGIPSAREIKQKGLDVSDVLAKQMQKIEELTLYMIEMQKENQGLKNRLNALEKQVTQN